MLERSFCANREPKDSPMYRRKPLTSRPFALTSFCRTARLIPCLCSASTSFYVAGDTRFMSTGFMIRCLTEPKSIAIRAGTYDIEWHNVGACLWRPLPTYQNRLGFLGSSDFSTVGTGSQPFCRSFRPRPRASTDRNISSYTRWREILVQGIGLTTLRCGSFTSGPLNGVHG
jgi:hypothetical protein